ncbi:MAG: TetR/AcrR family transcriptional regulator [Silicimonas sp.]|nr:TetR/AcrR family transcriptional regulator [Silicimonas sp.]NND18022.1 TetR/AcrR family transcriptional regulator [Silicimonas sp.]NNL35330.1 TetR/AcrR family transcriptional regulator [Silicimonas sp.]NNL73628.1 TetR/AcrR family transcriptional regulator [Silicimonas sp.]
MSSEKNPTRSRILNATWNLLENGGGNAVRMSDIAKAAKISRQALYLHFPNRAELLIATARHLDEVHEVDRMLAASRAATGPDRLDAWIEAWGGYIPRVFGMAKALMAMMDSDTEAAAAWQDRMDAVRDGCRAAVQALVESGDLRPGLTADEATDLLSALLSVRTWEQLRHDRGWTQERYIEVIGATARRSLMA